MRKRQQTAVETKVVTRQDGLTSMRTLTARAVFVLLVIIAVGGLCSLVTYKLGTLQETQAAIAGTAVAIPAAFFTLLILSRYGTGPGGMIAVTLARPGMTAGLASYVAWEFSNLRTLPFFLTITVVYLASLFVETWLVLKDFQRSGVNPES